MIDVSVQAGAWPAQEDLAETAKTAVEAATAAASRAAGCVWPGSDPDGEVSILFTDDATIRALNERWRGQDKTTNVLSFAQDGPGRAAGMFGDIVLAQETVAREAALEGKLLDHHIAHMIVHGFLHLLGYDHQNDQDAETMEYLERKALKLIGIADPYALPGTEDD
ncbi:MAG TPA: rRNA maturation RNase YbeY [Afifellaceae bacterium]|nr:rRNA maturation RNase YbeY [Afifellaceae bacterium]